MDAFRSVRVHRTVLDAVERLVESAKNPSGAAKYGSMADFVEKAIEVLLAREAKA